jgi:hypothetical protein
VRQCQCYFVLTKSRSLNAIPDLHRYILIMMYQLHMFNEFNCERLAGLPVPDPSEGCKVFDGTCVSIAKKNANFSGRDGYVAPAGRLNPTQHPESDDDDSQATPNPYILGPNCCSLQAQPSKLTPMHTIPHPSPSTLHLRPRPNNLHPTPCTPSSKHGRAGGVEAEAPWRRRRRGLGGG